MSPSCALWRLSPSVQRYDWGDPEFIPKLLGMPETGDPVAEAWYGAHPSAPATALTPDGQTRGPLDAWVAREAHRVLGPDVEHRFGRLPYLLKILAAAEPLSIQVHPNLQQARDGFADEERARIPLDAPHRRYRDHSHKPELLVAATRFDALCGFRSPSEIARIVGELPELRVLLPRVEPTTAGVEALLRAYFAVPSDRLDGALTAWVERLSDRDAQTPYESTEPEFWVLRAHRRRPVPDRGLLFVVLLELIHLDPGDGIFLPAGVPHAYLRGAGVELMAASDNVLRAGLTSKHVDPAELLRIVRFDARRPPILRPIDDAAGLEGTYAVPAVEFDLRRFSLVPAAPIERVAEGPETLLVTSGGPVRLECDGAALELSEGDAALVPHGVPYRLTSDSGAVVYRAKCPVATPASAGRITDELAGSTSGSGSGSFGDGALRGACDRVNERDIYEHARAFCDVLIAAGDAVPGTHVAWAAPPSAVTDRFARAITRAVLDAGLELVTCGAMSPQALADLRKTEHWPSIELRLVTPHEFELHLASVQGELSAAGRQHLDEALTRVHGLEARRSGASGGPTPDGTPEDGIVPPMSDEVESARFVAAVRHNIAATASLFSRGNPAAVIGTVSGSSAAQRFWQQRLDVARPSFRARDAISFVEDLPVNQALGLLLLWQRLRDRIRSGEGALIAFVFGEGTRATPLTEAECGQKPAITSFVAAGKGEQRRYLPTVELALRYFAPIEDHLRRSGFDGMVVKWGDEIQIPTVPLEAENPRFADADVIRFVSLRAITEQDAENKDWVGVDPSGKVTAFIPRRPLSAMNALADRGLLQRTQGTLYGGVNLGSIALSRRLLDLMLDEFEDEVADPTAARKDRPDLDPQLFTALTIAAIDDAQARGEAWTTARAESAAIDELQTKMPRILERLRGVLERFEGRWGRKVRMVAMDFGDQYWGDIGQHRQMYALYSALRARGPQGEIARALAGLPETRDERGNILAGDTVLGPDVRVRDSVLIDVHLRAGDVDQSVLVGTRCHQLHAARAFDVLSTARDLRLAPRSGSYKVVESEAVELAEGQRATTVFLPEGSALMRVHEDTDLRDRATNYDRPILGNPLSFRDTHRRVLEADPAELEARRARARAAIDEALQGESSS